MTTIADLPILTAPSSWRMTESRHGGGSMTWPDLTAGGLADELDWLAGQEPDLARGRRLAAAAQLVRAEIFAMAVLVAAMVDVTITPNS